MFMDKWGHLSKPAPGPACSIRPDLPVDDFLRQLSQISQAPRAGRLRPRGLAEAPVDRRPEPVEAR